MSLDLEQLPPSAHLVPVFKPTLAGVDFLNLRQVNLDLMGECIPGTNNATKRIRAYSLITWVYWIYPQLLEKKGSTEADSEELIHFREKVESLFVWSHQLDGEGGMPGITAQPPKPKNGKHDLRFKAWKRSRANTSLQAAVQYGPSLLDLGGLGLLHKVSAGVYACNPAGRRLAEALDEQLSQSPAYPFLIDLAQLEGTEDQARDLLPYWRFENTSIKEAVAFSELLWDPDHINEKTPRGRRASMIELILAALSKSNAPLDVAALRQRLALPDMWSAEPLPEGLHRQSRTWLLLQLRQLQRFAIESLMAWLENQLLTKGHQLPNHLVSSAIQEIESELGIDPAGSTNQALAQVHKPIDSLSTFQQTVLDDPDWFSPWNLCDQLTEAVKERSNRALTTGFYSLLLLNQCRPFLEQDDHLAKHLEHGGAARQSLGQWFRIVERLQSRPLGELVDWTLKNLVISQHLAVGTQRFDGEKIRLRMIIDEDGLETLLDKHPWQPGLTPDRLASLLSLLEGCTAVVSDEEGNFTIYTA